MSTPSLPPSPVNQIIHPDTLPVIVAQYELIGHRSRTEHWALTVLAAQDTIHTFEVRGNTDSYTYVPLLNVKHTLSRYSTYRGGCHVGNIPKDAAEEMQEKFREIPVVKLDPAWDSQNWVLEAIKLMKEEGWLFQGVNEAFVRKELGEDMARWQVADDTVDERLLSEMETGIPVSPAAVEPPPHPEHGTPSSSPKSTTKSTNCSP